MKEQVQKRVNIQDYNLGRNKRKLIENWKFPLKWLLQRTRSNNHVVASGGKLECQKMRRFLGHTI
jgi:hypothetical protein